MTTNEIHLVLHNLRRPSDRHKERGKARGGENEGMEAID